MEHILLQAANPPPQNALKSYGVAPRMHVALSGQVLAVCAWQLFQLLTADLARPRHAELSHWSTG
eukprot:216368-Amphidinium_carterae.1